jgi:hypothetical protein
VKNQSSSNCGKVVQIFIAKGGKEPMQEMTMVKIIPNAGIEGDRFSMGQGTWQKKSAQSEPKIRDVSFIRKKDILNSHFDASETRRNIVIETDEDLLAWIGKKFSISGVTFVGTEDCPPCGLPSQLANKPGFAEQFKGVGGLRAQSLSEGFIQVGDLISIISD